ncbi:MAG: stage IV sporulation protein A [Clostridia bacterium]
MDMINLYADIAERTGGNIYFGVVGPVRTGKSTFIKRFMDLFVLPEVNNEFLKNRITDELPQSGAGKTIMTTQPNFVPNEAVSLSLKDGISAGIRFVDCVGYLVPGALGHIENNSPRMVRTPWFDHDIPFEQAAEIGTRKVITEHSTIGIVMTTDGSITEIPRTDYESVEARVIAELNENNKPFIIIVNSAHPNDTETQNLCTALSKKYAHAALSIDALNMSESDAETVISTVLMEFPVKSIHIDLPAWVTSLDADHPLLKAVTDKISLLPQNVCMKDLIPFFDAFSLERYKPIVKSSLLPGSGAAEYHLLPLENVFYGVLSDECGFEITDESALVAILRDFSVAKKEYDRLKTALSEVNATGYGLVTPNMDEMTLYEPEIVRQGNRFGVKLHARASGLHIIRVDIASEISPLVGTEEQSEELVKYLNDTFLQEPEKIWETNIFGKPLYDLVCEGMTSKIGNMPQDVRDKLRETLERIVNEGCNGLFCIMV